VSLRLSRAGWGRGMGRPAGPAAGGARRTRPVRTGPARTGSSAAMCSGDGCGRSALPRDALIELKLRRGWCQRVPVREWFEEVIPGGRTGA
jgi:hypothetical protein